MKIKYIHAVPVGDTFRIIYGIEREVADRDAYKQFLQKRHITEISNGKCIEEIPRQYR